MGHLQLCTVAGMPFPVPGNFQRFPTPGEQEIAQDRHPMTVRIGQQAGNGKMGIGILEGNVLDAPTEGNGRIVWRCEAIPV